MGVVVAVAVDLEDDLHFRIVFDDCVDDERLRMMMMMMMLVIHLLVFVVLFLPSLDDEIRMAMTMTIAVMAVKKMMISVKEIVIWIVLK